MNDCIFCKIAKKEIGSETVIYEDADFVSFLDLNPVNKGHALIIPKSHYTDILETNEKELSKMLILAKKLAVAIMKATDAKGFNLTINTKPEAGQTVFHTHLHIVPRFKGDGFEHWKGTPASSEERSKVAKLIQQQLK